MKHADTTEFSLIGTLEYSYDELRDMFGSNPPFQVIIDDANYVTIIQESSSKFSTTQSKFLIYGDDKSLIQKLASKLQLPPEKFSTLKCF
jgi:hypothetical protein